MVNIIYTSIQPTSQSKMFRWFNSTQTKSLPRPQGPFSVGFIDYEWSPKKSDHCDNPPSYILSRIYYPSAPTERHSNQNGSVSIEQEWANKANWIPSPAYYPGYGYYMKMPWYLSSPLFRLVAGNAKIWASENAPPVTPDRLSEIPVVIFSHGLGGIRTTYSSICTELASHGFIVAAIEHRDGSASMSYLPQDETVLQYKHPPSDDKEAHHFRSEQLKHRRQEVSAAIDLLLSEKEFNVNLWKQVPLIAGGNDFVSNPLQLLKNQIRRDKVMMVGHSFGAATSFLSSQEDQRIAGVLALDPWMFPLPDDFNNRIQTHGMPTLVINTETFHWRSNLESISKTLYRNKELCEECPSLQLTIKGSSHMDQSDFSALIPDWILNRYRQSSLSDPTKILLLNHALSTSFLFGIFSKDRHLPQSPYNALIWEGKEGDPSAEDGFRFSPFKVDIKL